MNPDREHERIDAARVRRSFSQATDSYDAHAVLQREIADRLLAHLAFVKLVPGRVLDVGCGTGYFTRLLRARWPKAAVVGLDLSEAMLHAARRKSPRRGWFGRRDRQGWICGDGCRLPFADGSFDLVCSNLAMQWAPDPLAMMAEMRRVLAPGGLMVFSTFGRRTLSELRRTLAEIDPAWASHVLAFPDVTDLGDALMTLPVELPVTDTDLFTLTYPDAISLLRELK
ncbi:MAG: malonyl-ACP O-methyltransferase BioC, partial [Mariprofundaceae bacterium]